MKNPEWCIWGLCTGYIVGCTNAWHARLLRKLFLVFLPNWILGDSQGTYIVGVISKEEYYGLFIGFRPSGRVQPVQLWWLVNLPVNSLSQIFTFDLLRLTSNYFRSFCTLFLVFFYVLLNVVYSKVEDTYHTISIDFCECGIEIFHIFIFGSYRIEPPLVFLWHSFIVKRFGYVKSIIMFKARSKGFSIIWNLPSLTHCRM